MAEVTSTSPSKDAFPKASLNSTTAVVAPPKFVFGSGMSERVKKKSDDDDNDESDVSEKEEQLEMDSGLDFLECASASLKRSADSEDESSDLACPDFLFTPKKMLKTESSYKAIVQEQKMENVLRPSALSDIANKLTHTKQHVDIKKTTSDDQEDKKTCGECSNSSSSSSESSTRLSRPHLIDTPASLNTSAQSENYFQQFLTGDSKTSSTESKGKDAFVFGQNLRARVDVQLEQPSAESSIVATEVPKEGADPQSLAELADKGKITCSDTAETSQTSIAAAAQKYESEHSPPKQSLTEVHVITGEEDERNVLQVNCKLFTFCKKTHSWLGRGRVILRLNDHCQLNSEGKFLSRLVARTQGSLRLVLNTKLWPDMTIEKASEKAIRFSAMVDGAIHLYLVTAAPREAMQLYTAIDRRIRTLQRDRTTISDDPETNQTDSTQTVSKVDDSQTASDTKEQQSADNKDKSISPDFPIENEKN